MAGTIADYMKQMDADIAAAGDPQPQPVSAADSGPATAVAAPAQAADTAPAPVQADPKIKDYLEQVNQDIATRGADEPVKGPESNGKFLVNSALKGLSNIFDAAGYAGQIENQGVAAQTTGEYQPPVFYQSGSDLQKAVTGRDDYRPADGYTRPLVEAVGRGIESTTSALPFAMFGPAAVLGGSFVGGTTGDALRQGGAALGLSPGLQTALDIGGNLAGGFAGGSVAGRIPGAFNPSQGVRDLQAAGITARSPQIVGGGGMVTEGASNLPFTGSALKKQAADAVDQYGQFADSVAGTYGPDASPQQIGSTIIQKSKDYVAKSTAEAKKAFGAFEQRVPLDTTGTADATLAKLGLTKSADGTLTKAPAPTMEGPPEPSQFGQLRDAFVAAKQGGQLDYGTLKNWRTAINKAADYDALNGGVNNAKLKQLAGALTDDMEGIIGNKAGPDAVQSFRDMNSAYGQSQKFIEDRIGKLADAGLTPESVFNRLAANPKSTTSTLKQLVDNGVLDMNDINMISRMQLQKMGQTADGTWSPSQFFKQYQKLNRTSPETSEFLFNKGLGDSFNDQYDLLGRLSEQLTGSEKMISAAAKKSGLRYLLGGALEAGAGAGAVHFLANPASAVGMAGAGTGALGVDYGLSKLLTTRWFTNMLSKPTPNAERFAAAVSTQAKFHPEYSDELNSIADAVRQRGDQ